MPMTHGSALWQGGIKDGKGAISTKSGALKEYPYGFASRFEGKPGTNPEELIGAAHAGCFTMALSLILGEAKPIAMLSYARKLRHGRVRALAGRANPTYDRVPHGSAPTPVAATAAGRAARRRASRAPPPPHWR